MATTTDSNNTVDNAADDDSDVVTAGGSDIARKLRPQRPQPHLAVLGPNRNQKSGCLRSQSGPVPVFFQFWQLDLRMLILWATLLRLTCCSVGLVQHYKKNVRWNITLPLPRRFATHQLVAPISPIHDLHHLYLAARKPPEPRHNMQDSPLTRLRTSLNRNRQPTSTTQQHNLQDPTTANPQPRCWPTHPDPARKATNPVTVTPQHGTRDYNPPLPTHRHTSARCPTPQPPTHCHTPARCPTPQPPTHCHGTAHDAQDSATANPRYTATAHTPPLHHAATAASYNLV
ncbi:hypothetical protein EDB89DRAFT_1911598 [Lactarius sanguifluus]|nr:hypothetical protein EDB89DRAFT_1911598 [Lactarius sanguifluus]